MLKRILAWTVFIFGLAGCSGEPPLYTSDYLVVNVKLGERYVLADNRNVQYVLDTYRREEDSRVSGYIRLKTAQLVIFEYGCPIGKDPCDINEHPKERWKLHFSRNGNVRVSLSKDFRILHPGPPTKSIVLDPLVSVVAQSPDGSIVSFLMSPTVELIDAYVDISEHSEKGESFNSIPCMHSTAICQSQVTVGSDEITIYFNRQDWSAVIETTSFWRLMQ